jgi:hypothetical protein
MSQCRRMSQALDSLVLTARLVGNTDGNLVVAIKERRRLRISKIGPGLAFRDGGPGGAEVAGLIGLLDAGVNYRNARGGD